MSIYQEYYNAQKELEQKYGSNSLVLMQVGSFYEAYGVNLPNNKPPIKIGHTEEISEILSMQIAYKNGRSKEHSKTNPQMVGFPDYALGNHLSKLLKHGFTIAIYDQFDGDTIKKDRKLVNIYSASTYIDEDVCEANALMVIGVDSYKCPLSKKMIDHAKCAIFDLKTGDINLTEIYNTADDKRVETELHRLIYTFNPSEIVTCNEIKCLEGRNLYNIPLKKIYLQTSYQNEFLGKIYGKQLISPIEHLGLVRHSDLIPYFIHGLQYAYEHDPLIISKIKPPTILDNDHKLILNNDSIYQLHLIEGAISDFGNSKYRSVFGLLNQTRTAMGKRMLRNRLLMPITDPTELERRYDLITRCMPSLGKDKLTADKSETGNGIPSNNTVNKPDTGTSKVDKGKPTTNKPDVGKDKSDTSKSKPQNTDVNSDTKKSTNKAKADNQKMETYDDLLRGIADIELKYRKMATKKLHPYELASLNDTFSSIQQLLKTAKETFCINEESIAKFAEFYAEYLATFDLDILKESKLGTTKNSYFRPGVCPEIDNIQIAITQNIALLEELAGELSSQIDDKQNVSIDFNLNDKYHLKSTKVRFKKISEDFDCTLSNGTYISYSDLEVTTLTSNVKITSPQIIKISKLIVKAQSDLTTINKHYFATLDKWCNKWGNLFVDVAQILAEIDFTISAAKIASQYRYVRPLLTNVMPPQIIPDALLSTSNDSLKNSMVQTKVLAMPQAEQLAPPQRPQSEKSHIKATGLRHPMIERIVTAAPYVSNDVSLGVDHHGTIIYGVNMSGKSSLLRSIGIAVVMAQAGMFVAAKSFEYAPFTNMISKITVQDNEFKGQSLFMVEMSAVNNMLRRADSRSLILSDELGSSTDTLSGHAIVASTLKQLAEKKVNFVFSTHLHELQKIPEIINNPSIKIMHFKVDVGNNEMVFDRKLQDGGIPDTYGLEIASALGLPKDFIAEAFRIRDYLRAGTRAVEPTSNVMPTREIVPTKQSRHNKDVNMKHCALCGIDKSLETHHILFQCTADKKQMIETDTGPIHKNQQFNLIVVCQDCHIRIHKNEANVKIEPLKIKI